MSSEAIVIDSDDEPQPKKQKQDRSPLVVINGENGSKRKQLTLKDMVSPKPKQSTLSNFKVITKPAAPISNKQAPEDKTDKQSPKEKTNKQATDRSPKEKQLVTSSVDNKDSVTPVRGVKRKSDFGGEEEENGATPVKQAKLPEPDKYRTEESPKSRSSGKKSTEKPTLASMLIRSPKGQSLKKVNTAETDKKNEVKSSESEVKSSEKEVKSSEKEVKSCEKGEQKTPEVEATIPVKPVKKKFGDYKRKETKRVEPTSDNKEVKPASSSFADKSPLQAAKVDTETFESDKKADQNMDDSPQTVTSAVEAKENVEPTTAVESKTPKKDGSVADKASPASISKPIVKKQRPLTEKQKRLQEEREKKRLEVEKEKERKRLEREKEKEAREEVKRAEQAKKEAEKLAREKAREEARVKKEEERKQREEEKRQKEEEKRLKEEEKEAERKKKMQENEEEKRLKEEELEKKRQKKLKEQEKFKSFFVVKKPNVASSTPKVETLEKKFRDFVITPNMLLAPITRTEPVTGDIIPAGPVVWESNLAHIRGVVREMRSKEKYQTDQLSSELEFICISKPNEIKVKRKTLHFHENHRPAYYGSWRKKSSIIGPRRPFAQDKAILEYDYDSDEDWEEEEEGEDISSEKEDEKEEEKEKEKDEDDDEDDGFFVPHGYLSDDEGDEDCGMTDEAKKKRLEQRKKQFEEEQKSKESGVLKAQIIGPVWQNAPTSTDQSTYLAQFSAVWSSDLTEADEPFDPFARVQPVAQMETDSAAVKNDKKALPVAGYGMLIRFLHGSPIGMSRAVETFQEMWHSDPSRGRVSKRQLTQLIPTLVKKYMRPGSGNYKLCWYASDELLTDHGLTDLLGMHLETPEPPKPQPPTSGPLLKFTKTSSAEQDLALLKQQQQQQQWEAAQAASIRQQQLETALQQKQQQSVAAQQRAQQSMLEALQEAVKQQKLQQQQQHGRVETPPLNTLKNFLSSAPVSKAPVKRALLLPVNTSSGVISSSNGVISSSNGVISSSNGVISTSSGVNSQNPANPPKQPSGPAPRRIALVPIKNITSSTKPIDIDDSN